MRLALLFLALAARALALTYSTAFPATENPISQGGIWVNGLATGLVWSDVRTTPGLAFGTQSGSGGTNDSTAILTGSWGATQTCTGIAHVTNQQTGNIFEEIEFRLRSTLTANSCTGYEVIFSAKSPSDPQRYVQIVRWNGPFNSFTLLDAIIGPGLSDGDTCKATISGNTITAYINNVQILQSTDGTYSTGNPGIGFYLQGGTSALNSDYGWSSINITDGLGGANAVITGKSTVSGKFTIL